MRRLDGGDVRRWSSRAGSREPRATMRLPAWLDVPAGSRCRAVALLGMVAALATASLATTVPTIAQDRRPPAAEPKKPADADADPPLDAEAQKSHDAQVAFWVKRLRGEKNREQARLQIGQLGREKSRAGRDALIAFATGNSNQEFVTHAFRALAAIGGKTVVEFLSGADAVRSRDFLVQLSAAESLGDTKDARATAALLEVVQGKMTKIEVQAACLRALGTCSKADPAAIDVLLRFAEHKHDTVRAGALEGLGYVATDAAFQALVRHLKDDKNTRCRGSAATGLANSGRKDAVEPLLAAREDDSLTVREAVLAALRRLGVAPEPKKEPKK